LSKVGSRAMVGGAEELNQPRSGMLALTPGIEIAMALLTPAAARYAGNHSLALRWKIEAVCRRCASRPASCR
jgi:hypothetical protein